MNILLIEDHKLLAKGLENSLYQYPEITNFKAITDAFYLENLIDDIKKDKIDLILMDINIKKISPFDGLELSKKILHEIQIPILILTGYDYPAFESEAKSIGVRGFVGKEIETQELFQIIQRIINREKDFFSLDQKTSLYELTPKELELVRLYASGLTRVEVAEKMNIKLRTFCNKLQDIYSKLGCDNYQGMVNRAIEEGYLKDTILK